MFTGGSIEILREPTVGADAAAIVLRDLGVGGDRLILERKARNTAENALLAKRSPIPSPGERWLLVTSAWHMPRAIGLFRKAGFDVEAWPGDYRTAGPGDAWMLFASPVEGLRRLDFVVKEWLGLVGELADRALRRAASRRRSPQAVASVANCRPASAAVRKWRMASMRRGSLSSGAWPWLAHA